MGQTYALNERQVIEIYSLVLRNMDGELRLVMRSVIDYASRLTAITVDRIASGE